MAHVDAAPANEFGLLADEAAPWPGWFRSEPRTIVMQPTTFCNLDCGYCYLPDRQRKKDMSMRVATAVAASIPDSWSQVGAVEVVWHGGEPLAAGRRHLVELLEVFETLRVAGRVQHSLQTNATLITDAWCDIFIRYDVAVGVSLDGAPISQRQSHRPTRAPSLRPDRVRDLVPQESWHRLHGDLGGVEGHDQ
jgi:sulfatase maturation enzyme AslB (radical SAM superfamily)